MEPFTHGDGGDPTRGEGPVFLLGINGSVAPAPREFYQENDMGVTPVDEGLVSVSSRPARRRLRSSPKHNELTSSRGSLQGSTIPAPASNPHRDNIDSEDGADSSCDGEGSDGEGSSGLGAGRKRKKKQGKSTKKGGSKGGNKTVPESLVVKYYVDRHREEGGDMSRGTKANPFKWQLPDGLAAPAGHWLQEHGFSIEGLPPLGDFEEEMNR